MDLLARAHDVVRARGFACLQADLTIIAEQPRLAPHVEAMAGNLARRLGIGAGDVSVKAKTNERMGFIGRGKGWRSSPWRRWRPANRTRSSSGLPGYRRQRCTWSSARWRWSRTWCRRCPRMPRSCWARSFRIAASPILSPSSLSCGSPNVAGALAVYLVARRYGRRLFASPRRPPARGTGGDRGDRARVPPLWPCGIFLARFLPGIRAVVPPFAGIVNLSPLRAGIPITLASGSGTAGSPARVRRSARNGSASPRCWPA